MEVVKTDCYRCKQNYENPLELSCKHNMCQKCLTRTILKKNLTELQDKDTFIIPCKCKNGNIELTLSKMGEIIKQNLELSAIKCKNHELDCIKYCKECNKFLCEKCIESHTDLFNDHTVTNVTDSNNKPISITGLNEKCPKHNKDFSSYCKNCKVSFCTICLNEEEVIKPHEGHEIVPYKNYFDKVIEISNKLQFKNYEECKEHINQIEGEFDKQYKENLSKTVKSLENTIEILTKTLDNYKKKMESKFATKTLIMTIIKKVYYNYYEDLKNVKEGRGNIMLMKHLSNEFSEFSDLTFHSDLDIITSKLEKIKQELENEDIANCVTFKYSFFAKKELKLESTINNQFKQQINDIIELKDEKICVASEDNTIKIFDKENKLIVVLNGHVNGVRALCLLKEGKIASGSADKTVRIWDLRQNKTINILKEQSNQVITLNLLHGDKLASCSFREIFIYDEHFRQKYVLKEHSNWIRGIIPIDRYRTASCSEDGTIKIYDKHFRMLNTLKDHNDSVMSICYLRDGRMLSGDKNGKIIIWSKTLSYLKEFKAHESSVLSIKQLKDGRIVTCSSDKTIKLWELDLTEISIFKNHTNNVNIICTLKDGGFCSGGSDCIVNIYH